MGLDNIIYETKGVSNKELSKALEPLCGASFMCDDNNSFRGKVYSDFVEAISGYDLYGTDEWGHEELESIVSSFDELIKEDKVDEWLTSYNKSNDNVWGIDYKKDEFMAFHKVFTLCMDNGWRINAWF
jgi:hypothetical protein